MAVTAERVDRVEMRRCPLPRLIASRILLDGSPSSVHDSKLETLGQSAVVVTAQSLPPPFNCDFVAVAPSLFFHEVHEPAIPYTEGCFHPGHLLRQSYQGKQEELEAD
jgi:hypothetical protein